MLPDFFLGMNFLILGAGHIMYFPYHTSILILWRCRVTSHWRQTKDSVKNMNSTSPKPDVARGARGARRLTTYHATIGGGALRFERWPIKAVVG